MEDISRKFAQEKIGGNSIELKPDINVFPGYSGI